MRFQPDVESGFDHHAQSVGRVTLHRQDVSDVRHIDTFALRDAKDRAGEIIFDKDLILITMLTNVHQIWCSMATSR